MATKKIFMVTKHIVKMKMKQKGKVVCDICARSFTSQRALIAHTRIHRTPQKAPGPLNNCQNPIG